MEDVKRFWVPGVITITALFVGVMLGRYTVPVAATNPLTSPIPLLPSPSYAAQLLMR